MPDIEFLEPNVYNQKVREGMSMGEGSAGGSSTQMEEERYGMTKYVYLFKEGNASMRELLGGKGANLAEMTKSSFSIN